MFDQLSDPQFWQQVREVAVWPVFGLAALAFLVGSVCWIGALFCALPGTVPKASIQFLAAQKTLSDLFKPSSMTVILYEDFLTPRGLVLRRCAFVALAIFAVCFVTMVLLGSLAPRP
ncbi:MAG: hypothetical protein Kow00114_03930 [Kiloniellaceae bacterium]